MCVGLKFAILGANTPLADIPTDGMPPRKRDWTLAEFSEVPAGIPGPDTQDRTSTFVLLCFCWTRAGW